MAQANGLQQVSGTGTAQNGGPTTTSVIASQGATKTLRLTKWVLTVSTAATGGGGLARICDGTTTIIQYDANAVGAWTGDFGEVGYPLTAGNALQVIVSGAVTNQATATLTALAVVA